MKKEIRFEEKIYESLAEFCKVKNLNYDYVYRRLKKGYSLKKAIEPKKQIKDHLGNVYSSYKEMAQKYNINYSTFIYRIDAGTSIKTALTSQNTSPKNNRYMIPKEHTPVLKEIVKNAIDKAQDKDTKGLYELIYRELFEPKTLIKEEE